MLQQPELVTGSDCSAKPGFGPGSSVSCNARNQMPAVAAESINYRFFKVFLDTAGIFPGWSQGLPFDILILKGVT